MASLLEFESAEKMTREQAAERLRTIADQLERHNDLEFTREGQRYVVDVADEVTFEMEFEIGEDGSELEIEISW